MLKPRLNKLSFIASVLVREYAGLRHEFARINAGEPGYREYVEILAPQGERAQPEKVESERR